ncbi:hypothetical protein [Vulcanisaeta thermophila]|uniref:hypothetical protein n=1 Tax=Vulcanisaeta thermophila TaxID=867917 RepID=UPI000852AA76|nr:hypothetical protein [Vulcanisaeta thermophila]
MGSNGTAEHGTTRHRIGVAMISIGVAVLLFAVYLAYTELIQGISYPQPPSLESILYVLTIVMYKTAFIAIIAWVGGLLITRGLQSLG